MDSDATPLSALIGGVIYMLASVALMAYIAWSLHDIRAELHHTSDQLAGIDARVWTLQQDAQLTRDAVVALREHDRMRPP